MPWRSPAWRCRVGCAPRSSQLRRWWRSTFDTASATAGREPKAAMQEAANRAALPELVRQIRLRNLSGAILVDLAGLSLRRRAALAEPLRAALATDPVGPRLLGFTAGGLAEIQRPRLHPPLHEMLAGAICRGVGCVAPGGGRCLCGPPAVTAGGAGRSVGAGVGPGCVASPCAPAWPFPCAAVRPGVGLMPLGDRGG